MLMPPTVPVAPAAMAADGRRPSPGFHPAPPARYPPGMRSTRCCALAFVAALAWAVVLSHHGSSQDAGAPGATDAAAAGEGHEQTTTEFEAAGTTLNIA